MSDHAILPPSGAHIWANCSAAPIAQQGRPDPDTQEAREGTAAHWVMAETLLVLRDGERWATCADYIGQTAPNGVVIDDTMAEGAQVVVDDVLAVCNTEGGLSSLFIELRVRMPCIHPENWGTLDVGLYLRQQGRLFVWDYKHGHRETPARENLQLIDYAAGLAEQLGINGHTEQYTMASLRIVQPFCYRAGGPVDEWLVTLAELRPYWNRLANMAGEAMTSPSMTTGLHCRDCRALPDCKAARGASYNLVHLAKQPVQLDTMAPRDLAVEWRILTEGQKLLKARLEAIEDTLQHQIKTGDTSSGLTLEVTQGRQTFNVPPEQVIAIAGQFGVDATKPGCKTPSQVLQSAPTAVKPMLSELFKSITHRPNTGFKLIQADGTKAARAFQRGKNHATT